MKHILVLVPSILILFILSSCGKVTYEELTLDEVPEDIKRNISETPAKHLYVGHCTS